MGPRAKTLLALAGSFLVTRSAVAFDVGAIYDVNMGQNSYGGGGGDSSGWQKNLAYYCQDDTVDVIPVSFLNTFFGKGGFPELNLANTCNVKDNATFPGTNMVNCPSIGDDIKYCQSRGKSIILSLGGAGGSYGFQNDAQAQGFATQVWNLFLGGKSDTRPFGDAVFDGVDLDIEGGGPTGYVAFVNQLRSYYQQDKSKKYLIAAAPQCVYPDGQLSSTLNNAWFDLVFVQFYNNPCGLQYYNNFQAWNYGIWDYWATHISPNPNVKVYIGAPAAPKAAGSGYITIDQLQTVAQQTRANFTSFGGVMFWDASQAWGNSFLKNGGGCNVKPNLPSCKSASTWAQSVSYPGGSVVSYDGYIWKALWYTQGQAPGVTAGYWNAISGCTGNGSGTTITATSTTSSATTVPPTSTVVTTSVSSTKPTSSVPSTTSATSSTPTTTPGGSCSGVAAWSSSTAYNGAQKVTYNGHLWQAKWWTQNDTPGSNSQNVWTDLGTCTTLLSSQKPGSVISDQWKLSFPFNSTLVQVNGAVQGQEKGAVVLTAPSIQDDFKANQFMSVFVDITGRDNARSALDKFPFPDINKVTFAP
ncbi:glycoside hydrolase [Basidiobolus meristosporus CBS 931.73]|uniref:chitinase n=1 Tax=Basidiobolus meristosporus CBS 931.73 TaxID=1314790 RepID=A0A1Y1Z2W9_9FUNG|nr:glycoside hydrolase [Basidiobolus meristosporus CBS 931.73]|eukprot:ORY04643.1 glycoside hydrolase [Basidiobolus meristosporus CBS 931.73]